MSVIASRDLRNHTAAVLRQVAAGAEVTITVHGEPVAVIVAPTSRRRHGIPRHEVNAVAAQQTADLTLAADLQWISAGSTDDLGPLA